METTVTRANAYVLLLLLGETDTLQSQTERLRGARIR
jgi:hypothetical protein